MNMDCLCKLLLDEKTNGFITVIWTELRNLQKRIQQHNASYVTRVS